MFLEDIAAVGIPDAAVGSSRIAGGNGRAAGLHTHAVKVLDAFERGRECDRAEGESGERLDLHLGGDLIRACLDLET